MFEGGSQATIKVVGYHPANFHTRQLPTILSTVSSYDTRTGHLVCIMDGTFLTALRTGAASAVASRILASPESRTLGLFGAGAQAVSQLHALSRVLDLDRVLVYDANASVQASFLRRARAVVGEIPIEIAPPRTIVEQADVICTVTSIGVGAGPIFDGFEPRPWAHFNAVGSDFRGKTELPLGLLQRAFVCPDFRQQAVIEGECQQLAEDDIGPDLYEVVQRAEELEPLRRSLTVFDSTGWALEDHVAMTLFMDLAEQLDLGTPVAVEAIPTDPLNPYQFLTDPAEVATPLELAATLSSFRSASLDGNGSNGSISNDAIVPPIEE